MTTFEQQENAAKVLDFLESHKDQHNQGFWMSANSSCGTAGCVAGWTTILCGDMTEVKYENGHTYYVDKEGNYRRTHCAPEIASDVLGLENEYDRSMLFGCESEKVAREALRYMAHGKQIDWVKLREDYGDWTNMWMIPQDMFPESEND